MWKIWEAEHMNEKYKFVDLSPCEQYLSPIQDEHLDSSHGQQLWRTKVRVRQMKSDLWWRNTMNKNLSWIIFHLWTSVVLPASGLMSVTVRKTGYESVPENKLGKIANWASLTEAQNRKGVYRIAGWLSIISLPSRSCPSLLKMRIIGGKRILQNCTSSYFSPLYNSINL